jgi:hypothetical protein
MQHTARLQMERNGIIGRIKVSISVYLPSKEMKIQVKRQTKEPKDQSNSDGCEDEGNKTQECKSKDIKHSINYTNAHSR